MLNTIQDVEQFIDNLLLEYPIQVVDSITPSGELTLINDYDYSCFTLPISEQEIKIATILLDESMAHNT